MIAAVLSWLVCVALLAAASLYGLRNAKPAFLAFALTMVVKTSIRPLIFFLGLDLPQPQTYIAGYDWGMMTMTNLVVVVWIFATVLFYVFFRPLMRSAGRALLPFRSREARRSKILLVTMFPTMLGVGATLYLVASYGGVDQFMYASKIGKDLKGLFVIKEAAILASIVAFYGFLCSVDRSNLAQPRLSSWSYLFGALMCLNMLSIYLWGVRYDIALLLMCNLLGWHLSVRRINLIKMALYVGLMAAALFLLREVRTSLISSAVGSDVSANFAFWQEASNSLHFAEYDALMLALRDAGHLFAFRGGEDFVNGLLSWVPRFIYHNKETFYVGAWFREVYQPGKLNGWPVTAIGSWYVNFGPAGILMGAAVSGAVIRWFDTAFRDIRTNPWSASVGIGLCFLMIDAGFDTGFPQRVVTLAIPLWLVTVFLRMRFRSTQTSRRPDEPTWRETRLRDGS